MFSLISKFFKNEQTEEVMEVEKELDKKTDKEDMEVEKELDTTFGQELISKNPGSFDDAIMRKSYEHSVHSDHEEIKKNILSEIKHLTIKEKEEIKNLIENQLVSAQEIVPVTVEVPNYEYKEEPYKKN
jgi:replicative DNA helicase